MRSALRTDIVRRLRQTGGRGRKLRGLLALLAPYRSRVIWMLVSLVAATAAALAPAPLAKYAIDDGIKDGDLGTLNIVVLEGGHIAARGTHEELLQESELYAEIASKGLPDQVFLNRNPIEKVAGL